MSDAQPAAPVTLPERITAIDTARGLALLGILVVNMTFFALPLGDVTHHGPPEAAGPSDTAAWWALKVLFEGKFFTIFSTLFGVGLTIQWARAHARIGRFGAMGLRRLGFLMLLGLLHATLLWYGDILFLYAWAGLLLLIPLHFRWSPRVCVLVACLLVWLATMFSGAMGVISGLNHAQAPPAAAATGTEAAPGVAGEAAAPAVEAAPAVVKPPFERLLEHWQSGRSRAPQDSGWREAETEAYREGPFSQAFLFRVMTWGMMLLAVTLLGMSFVILAMFLIGCALVRAGSFTSPDTRIFRRLLACGLLLGLPMSIAAVALMTPDRGAKALALAGFLAPISWCLVALGTISAVVLWVRSGVAAGIAGVFAVVGRFALTNYLLQTVVCTAIFYWWGLGKFGTMTRAELFVLAFAVYAGQVVLSNVMARVLAYGPMEWLWRTVTYWRPQPFLKGFED